MPFSILANKGVTLDNSHAGRRLDVYSTKAIKLPVNLPECLSSFPTILQPTSWVLARNSRAWWQTPLTSAAETEAGGSLVWVQGQSHQVPGQPGLKKKKKEHSQPNQLNMVVTGKVPLQPAGNCGHCCCLAPGQRGTPKSSTLEKGLNS